MALHEILLANLTRRLLDLGWHAAVLARRSGLSDATLSRILSGKQVNLTLETLQRLAAAVGLPAAALLTSPSRTGQHGYATGNDSRPGRAGAHLHGSLGEFLQDRYGYTEADAEELAEELEAMRRARDEIMRRRRLRRRRLGQVGGA